MVENNTAILLQQELLANKATVAVAESCTGGLLAHTITLVPGASQVFLAGIVAYTEEIKTALLHIPATLIARHGVVSAAVAMAMAKGIAKATGATYALSTTGIAGPSGGDSQTPIGTVFMGLHTPSGTKVFHQVFPGTRNQIQENAVYYILDALLSEVRSAQKTTCTSEH